MSESLSTFSWGHRALRIEFLVDAERRARVVGLSPGAPVGASSAGAALPIVEVHATGHGRRMANERYIQSTIGERLVYQGHEESREGRWPVMRVDLADPETGLHVEAFFRTPDGVGAVQSWSRLTNGSPRDAGSGVPCASCWST